MIYLFLFLLSFFLTYIIKQYAIKKSFVAEVNDRSSHSMPIPHGGGIAIAITWFIGISYLFFIHQLNSSLYFALMVGMIISVISYFDDLFELSAKIRLFTQALVALLALFLLGGFKELDLFLFSINNHIIMNVFAFFMIIWFINLYNFLDGIDGYAASEALFLSLAGFFIFHDKYLLVLAVAVLGFLVWNWHKAKIFMGDVGSTLLGYNVAIFTIYYANQKPANFWIWIILFSLFWFDATITLFRRYKNGERLSVAHKNHAYQRLNQSGWSHSSVAIFAIFTNIILFLSVYFMQNLFITLLFCLLFLYVIMKFIDSKKAFYIDK